MKKRSIAHSLALGSLLLVAPGLLFARDPKLPNPCRELKTNLDNQVNSLHQRQESELAECRRTSGKDADLCRDLKNQQTLALNQLRDQRRVQLDNCNPRATQFGIQPGTNACDRDAYRRNRNDCYPGEKYPEKPYKHPPKNPPPNPPVAHNPPKHPGDGGGRHNDGDAGDTRSAGNSGSSHHHSDHSSGSSSSGSGGSSGTSTSSNTSSGSSLDRRAQGRPARILRGPALQAPVRVRHRHPVPVIARRDQATVHRLLQRSPRTVTFRRCAIAAKIRSYLAQLGQALGLPRDLSLPQAAALYFSRAK